MFNHRKYCKICGGETEVDLDYCIDCLEEMLEGEDYQEDDGNDE